MKADLSAFLESLRLNRNASPHTVRAYESDLSQFLTSLANRLGRPVDALEPSDFDLASVRGFLADRHRTGNSRASAARKLAAVRAFARYLRREGQLDRDPASLVRAPKREQKLPAHLDIGEMASLVETPDTSKPLGRRDRAILELFYASGLRLSELVGLDLEDVNLGRRLVRVLGKGGKERIVPFNSSAAEAIRVYLRDREELCAGRRAAARSRSTRHAAGAALRELSRRAIDPAKRPPPGLPLRSRCAARGSESARMPSDTPLRRTSWSAAQICAPFRSCSAMCASARRSDTRT